MIAKLQHIIADRRAWVFPLTLALLLIFYVVGILGIAGSERTWFLSQTPMILVISMGLLLLNHQEWNLPFLYCCLLCLGVGYFVEVAGVATGVIFGNYQYGATLGFQVWGVPLTMAVNWLMLVLSSASIFARVGWPLVLKAAGGATLMTLLDVILEPVAMATDMWQWEGDSIPLRNYLVWWVVSFGLHLVYHRLNFKKQNKLGWILFAVQVLFFGLLNVIL